MLRFCGIRRFPLRHWAETYWGGRGSMDSDGVSDGRGAQSLIWMSMSALQLLSRH